MSKRFFILRDFSKEITRSNGHTIHRDLFVMMKNEEYHAFDMDELEFYHDEHMDQPAINFVNDQKLYREVKEEEFIRQINKIKAKKLLVNNENGV